MPKLVFSNRVSSRLSPDAGLSRLVRVIMLEIFRRNRFFNSLLLLPYIILVRIWSAFGSEAPEFALKGILSDWLIGNIRHDSALAMLLSILVVYAQVLMLNRLVIRNRLTSEMTLFPGVFYVLLVSFFPSYNGLSTPLLANTFVILGFDYLMATHKKTGKASRIFTAAFWLGTAFMTYFGYITIVFCGLIGLSMLRTVKLSEWLQYLFGLLAPVAIIAMLDYLFHSNLVEFGWHFTELAGIFSFAFPMGTQLYVQLAVFGVLIAISLLQYGRFTQRTNIQVQKRINLIYWMFFFMLGIVLVQKGINYEEWTTISLPLAVFTAMLFVRSKQLLLIEILHFALLLAVLAMQITVLL